MMASQMLMADDAALDKNLKNPVVVGKIDIEKLSIAKDPLISQKKPIMVNVPPGGPKGQLGPVVATYMQATLDKELVKVDAAGEKLPEKGIAGDLGIDMGAKGALLGKAATCPYPMEESFESSWRNNACWGFDSNECEWGETNCKPSEPDGSYSAWPFVVGSGCPRPCIDNYRSNAQSWMVYGPFSMAGVGSGTPAWLEFYLDLQSENGYDYIQYMASINGNNFYGKGLSGNTSGWMDITRDNYALDLTDVYVLGDLRGQSEVWIAFIFESDSSNNYKGPFIDDVRLGERVAFPNLVCYTPSGWPGPIVVSENPGDNVNDNPICGDTIYVDFALTDENYTGIPLYFRIDLCLDGNPCKTFVGDVPDGLQPGEYLYAPDVEFSVTPGSHTVSLEIDIYNEVAETNENDNRCEKPFTVGEPDIYVNPTSLNFGAVCIGDDLDKPVTVGNNGACLLCVSSTQITGPNASEFSIQSGEGSFCLNPGQTHEIKVRFKPTSAGSKTATLQIYSDDPNENPINVALSGASGVPDIYVTPTSLPFGDVCAGSYSDLPITVGNSGTCILYVSSTQITGSNASEFSIQSGEGSFSLNPGQTREIKVRFQPTSIGSKTATLEIFSDDPDEPQTNVDLKGKGTDPVITVNPPSHDFSINQGVDDFVCKEFIVKNDGPCQLQVTSTTLTGPDASEFKILSGGGSFNLNPGQTREVIVCFEPNSPGQKIAELCFASNDLDKPQLCVLLTGGPCGVTGDVSGNGIVTAYDASLIMQYVVGWIDTFPAAEMVSPVSVSKRDHYVVSIPHLASAPRSRVTLPILVDDASGITVGGISLRYDAQFLKAIKVTSADLLSDCYRMERIDEGEIRIAFVSAAPLNGSGELLYVEFEIVTSTPDFTDIALEEVSLGENIHVAKIDGSIEVLPTKTVLLANYPNPFNPETWIPYRLAEDATIKVSIYDAKGRTVRVIDLGHQPAGSYLHKDRAVYWNGRNNSGEKVASGIYYYQLQSGHFSAIRKLVVLK